VIVALVAHAQAARAERRLALETTVSGLKLLMASDGARYAPRGVVAGAVATLVHLGHPVVAMRVLAACWDDGTIDTPSATWVISEVFESNDPQAQLEAAAMLDARARELCGCPPGSFSWPSAIEFRWIPGAPLPARLRVFRSVLRMLVTKSPQWWSEGGRQGWAVGVLYDAMQKDPDAGVRWHAAMAVEILLPPLEEAGLTEIQGEGWVAIARVRKNVEHALANKIRWRQALTNKIRWRQTYDPATRQIVMLESDLKALKAWASPAT
jgi:hypothetical protein